ncbi:hypothetical protein DL96DRAFT_1211499 [Flagelloscypha sp. PMI_526]|nr:hypothetical protein DL96DRAFT_1211499 [Flagelloscypha sp. PMI_526]
MPSGAFFLSKTQMRLYRIRRVAIYSLAQDALLVHSNECGLPRLRNANNSTAKSIFSDVPGVGTRLKRSSSLITFVIGGMFALSWCTAVGSKSGSFRGKSSSASKRCSWFSLPLFFRLHIYRAVLTFLQLVPEDMGLGSLPCLIIVTVFALMFGCMALPNFWRISMKNSWQNEGRINTRSWNLHRYLD